MSNADIQNSGQNDVSQELHCGKDALTDALGWFLQVLLATLAFTCLICKYLILFRNFFLLRYVKKF